MYWLLRRAKEGHGKSTLAAHLAIRVHRPTRPCLLIDDDPQGSLSLWNEQRAQSALPLKIVKRDVAHVVKKAKQTDTERIFIDTPPNNSVSVIQAIEAATLVIIPCRPGLFDLEAVQDTIALARHLHTPYAVVFNAAPPRREGVESPAVTQARRYLSSTRSARVGRTDQPSRKLLAGAYGGRSRQRIRC